MPAKTKEKTIKSIMPADGWYALYKEPASSSNIDVSIGGEHYRIDALTCWALVEEDGDTYVEGMDAGGDIMANHCDLRDIPNFSMYMHARILRKHGAKDV